MTTQKKKRSVYADIRAERRRQDKTWGGPGHDDHHRAEAWNDYRRKFERRVLNDREYRESLVKIAALAVAQIESFDRIFPEAPYRGR